MQFYDVDGGGSLNFEEFMKFILPCDNPDIRAAACQKATYKTDSIAGKRLQPDVEQAMVDYFVCELNCHIKFEMSKRMLAAQPDWDTTVAFGYVDSQKQGYISHP